MSDILYFEADRNYTKLLLSEGIQFTFAINIGKIEDMFQAQYADSHATLLRVGKSFIINKNYILQINLPKQKLLLLTPGGKPRELTVSKEPLKALKDMLEQEGIKPKKNAE
jgi:DNA-binding LytR/AlgR family response regulator